MSSFANIYPRLPLKDRLLAEIVKREGGQLFSATLRAILAQHYGVEVGMYSYGSLLVPGQADRGTYIGRYVSVGRGVSRIGAAHPMEAVSMHPFWYNPRFKFVGPESDVDRTECVIGHDSWIGANATILPGCRRVGIGSVIGAGSVVTADVSDFSVVVGVPAREIRLRFTPSARKRILKSEYWQLAPDEARSAITELEPLVTRDSGL